jgi:hypothetical protein
VIVVHLNVLRKLGFYVKTNFKKSVCLDWINVPTCYGCFVWMSLLLLFLGGSAADVLVCVSLSVGGVGLLLLLCVSLGLDS